MRFTKNQLKKLGYPITEHYKVVEDYAHNASRLSQIVKGKFANIIDVIFTAKEGALNNLIDLQTSENTPPSVKMFIQNVMMADIPAVASAPDDETALDALIPRSVQTSAEIAPFVDFIKDKVCDIRQRLALQNVVKDVSSNT